MPAISSGKVLVTGANGFVATWIVKTYLEHGFAVRGTVRSESKAAHLRTLFNSYGDKFDIIIIQDMTKDGAFDEAVKGMDAIIHTASPAHLADVEPSEMIEPAVKGTVGVLASATAHAPSVRRVVLTSSIAAVISPVPPTRVFSEADWNTNSVEEIESKGRDASVFDKYCASKTLAERAAWSFIREHESEIGWELVVLLPPYVLGPLLQDVKTPEDLNESMKLWFDAVVKGTFDDKALANGGAYFVDVRDLALAHLYAVTKAEAGGERLLVCDSPFKWQDFVNIAHRLYPQLPSGNTGYDPAHAVHHIQYAPAKQRKVLGIRFHPIEEMTRDIVEDFKRRGWL